MANLPSYFNGEAYWKGGSGNLSSDFIVGYYYDSSEEVGYVFGGPTASDQVYFGATGLDKIGINPPDTSAGGTLSGSMSCSGIEFSGNASFTLDGSIKDSGYAEFGGAGESVSLTIDKSGSLTAGFGLLDQNSAITVDGGRLTVNNGFYVGLVVTFVPKVPFWKLRNVNALRPTCATTH